MRRSNKSLIIFLEIFL